MAGEAGRRLGGAGARRVKSVLGLRAAELPRRLLGWCCEASSKRSGAARWGGGTGHRAAQAGQGCILPKRERKADVGGGWAPSRNLTVEGKVKFGVSGT